jgi:hypothetical protein
VRPGQVQKTVRLRGGQCNPHRATRTQRGLHRSRLLRSVQCTCRGGGPSAALQQIHEPDNTPSKGRLPPTSEPLNGPWWTLCGYWSWRLRRRRPGRIAGLDGSMQPPEGAPDSQVGIPDVPWSWVEYSHPEEGLLPNLMDGGKPVRREDGGRLFPNSSTVGTSGTNPFGPAVASPFPCAWRRPRPAVAGAGIADSKGRR